MEHIASINDLWQAVVLFFENVNLQDVIQHHHRWFYTIVFVWAFLQGETFVIFAGAAAAQDILDVKLLILFASAGTFCGDQLYFQLGRRWGRRLLHRFPKLEHSVQKVLERIERHDRAFILAYRFIFGVRNLSPFALGLSHLTNKEFTRWNAAASVLAAFVFSMAGFLFGATLDNVLGETVNGVMIGVAVIVAVIFGAKYARKHWKKRKL